MKDDSSSRLGQFQNTHWSLVKKAQDDTATVRREALDELLRLYLPALRAHLVLSKRIDTDRANDLLQGFVAEKILQRDLITRADPAKGRFRSLLLRSLENYVVDQARRQKAQKRSAGAVLSLDQEGASQLSPAAKTDSGSYDLVWAKRTLFEVLGRMKQQCEQRGTSHTWLVFECRVVEPLLRGTPPVAYDELVRRLGFDSPKQATNALATGKRQFEESLRFVIGRYAKNDAELEEEISHLCSALSKAGTLEWQLPAGEPAAAQAEATGSPSETAKPAFQLEDTTLQLLAQMLDLTADPNEAWSWKDLAAIWRHQLSLPLEALFDHRDWQAVVGPLSGSAPAEDRVESLAKLLEHPKPSLEVLRVMKQLAKSSGRAGSGELPANIATALYFTSIAAALVRHDERISRSDDDVLRYGLRMLLKRRWLDEASTELFRETLVRLALVRLDESDDPGK